MIQRKMRLVSMILGMLLAFLIWAFGIDDHVDLGDLESTVPMTTSSIDDTPPRRQPMTNEAGTTARSDQGSERPDVDSSMPTSAKSRPDAERRGTLIVELTSASGAAVGNVDIELRRATDWSRRHLSQTARTDVAGRAVVENLDAGKWTVFFPRIESGRAVVLSGGETTTLCWRIGEAVDRDVFTVDENRRPIAGAEIWFAANADCPHLSLRVAVSDKDGRAHVDAILKRGVLSARAPGRRPSSIQSAAVEGALTFVLEPGSGAVAGRVVDADGRGVRGAVVRFMPENRSNSGRIELARSTITNNAGEFMVDDLTPCSTVLEAAAPGRPAVRRIIDVAQDAETRVLMTLVGGGTVAGVVRSQDGQPLADVVVSTGDRTSFLYCGAVTDKAGAYRLEDVSIGLIEMVADADARGRSREVIAVGPGSDIPWNPVVSAAGRILGRVIGPGFKGIPGIVVTVTLESPRPNDRYAARSAVSDARGRFVIADLEPRVHGVSAAMIDPTTKEKIGLIVDGAQSHAVPDGPELSILIPEDKIVVTFITGTVVDHHRDPIPDADVSVRRIEDKNPIPNYIVDPTSGKFSAGPLTPGRYRVEVESKTLGRSMIGEYDVVPERDINLGEIRLSPPGRLTALVRPGAFGDEKTLHANGPSGELLATKTTRDGKIQIPALRPGKVTLSLTDGKIGTTQEVEIRSGEETIVEFVVPK